MSSQRRRQRRYRPSMGRLLLEALEARQLLSFTFTKVADTSGQFTGFLGSHNSLPSINNQGTVAFQGLLTTGGAGLFTSSGGSAKLIVNTTGTFECFGSTSINTQGKVAFWAGLKTGKQGIYAGDGTAPLTTIVETNAWFPITSFGTEPVIDDVGFVLFNADWDINSAGWVSDNRTISSADIGLNGTGFGSVFTATTNNPYSDTVSSTFSGQDATHNEETAVCWAFLKAGGQKVLTATRGVTTSILDTQGAFNYLGIPTINDAGTTVALQATLASGGSEVITINTGGSPTIVADTNGAYSAFAPEVGVDGRGRVVFLASLDAGGKGLFTGSDPVKDKIIQTGDSLAGSTVTDLAFCREGINDSGQIVFWAKLANGKEGIYQTKATAFINHPPVAANDSYDAIQNTTLTVSADKGVLLNDHDPDGDSLIAKIVSQPKPGQGTVVLNPDGSFTYDPGNYHGVATFKYQASDGKLKSTVTTVSITVTADGQTPIAGWMYDVVNDKGVVTSYGTGYHAAQTPVQKAIVAAAMAAKGQPSGPSSVDGKWQTDIIDGDGGRILDAITTYDKWSRAPKMTLAQVKQEMYAELNDGGNGYKDPNDQKKLVDQIRFVYDNNPGKPLPTRDNLQTILDYLGIQKQCMEWANSIALSVKGTTYRSYDDADMSTLKPSEYRPGMGVFCTVKGQQHAMIIVNICWDAKGNPTQFEVAEANYGGGWHNPGGMVPWARTVHVGRAFPVAGYNTTSKDSTGKTVKIFHPVKVVSFAS